MLQINNETVLIVVAHPDDEVLGCGGTAYQLKKKGVPIKVCILCGDADVRQNRPEIPALHDQALKAADVMGLEKPILGRFPNIRFNTVPHVEMVQFIEEIIVRTGAQYIFTHHPGDLNDDHKCASGATQAASRLFQRRAGVPSLKGLYFMEVPSATDWSFGSGTSVFVPNAFFPIGEEGLAKKIESLSSYEGVMRPYPHPRSKEVLTGLAALRGGQAGMAWAEAFQVAFQLL